MAITVTSPDRVSVNITEQASTSVSVSQQAASSTTVTSKGPKGDKGDDGAAGATGATGATGAAGTDGKSYSVSCVDGDNSDEEKIRLTDSGTDDVVLEAAGSLTIARSSDKITFTNDRYDTRLKGDHFPCSNDSAASSFGHIGISANYWYGGVFRVEGQMNITHIGIQTKNGTNTDHDIVCGIYKYVYSSDSWTKVVQVGS